MNNDPQNPEPIQPTEDTDDLQRAASADDSGISPNAGLDQEAVARALVGFGLEDSTGAPSAPGTGDTGDGTAPSALAVEDDGIIVADSSLQSGDAGGALPPHEDGSVGDAPEQPPPGSSGDEVGDDDQGTGPQIDQNFNNVQGENVSIIGQVIYTREEESQPPRFIEVPIEAWRKVKAVYIRPTTFTEQFNDLQTAGKRLVVVHGPRQSGRDATAIAIALGLMSESAAQIFIYDRSQDDRRMLTDVVEFIRKSDKYKKPAVFILSDVDEKLLSHTARFSISLEKRLEEHKSFFILTTTPAIVRSYDVSGLSLIDAVLEAGKLPDVYDKHLTYYSQDPTGKRLTLLPSMVTYLGQDEMRNQLIAIFGLTHALYDNSPRDHIRPALVDRFFDRVTLLNLTSDPADFDRIIALAEQIAGLQYESPRLWFNRLRPNARLFAMLIYLFDGFERETLSQIYSQAVTQLRQDGVLTLRDARESGLRDLLQITHSLETKAGFVRFEAKVFEQEVSYQISNYYHQLWPLLEPLAELIVKMFSDPASWTLRKIVGEAIGRVGIYAPTELTGLLNKLAEHPKGSVVSISGYALNEVCRLGPEFYSYVLDDILGRWGKSQLFDQMWAAAAAYWRVYDTLASAAESDDPVLNARSDEALSQLHAQMTSLGRAHDKFGGNHLHKTFEIFRDNYQHTIADLEARAKINRIGFREKLFLEIERQKSPGQIERDLWNSLRGNLAQTMRDALSHAIYMIHFNHADRIAPLLATWLTAEQGSTAEDSLRLISLEAANRLFEVNNSDTLILEPTRHKPLLGLVGPLLVAVENAREGHMDKVRTMVAALLSWLRSAVALQEVTPEGQAAFNWQETIHTAMLRVVNRSSRQARTLLRTALSDVWLTSDFAPARRIGQALIARSLVMDGEPLNLPGQQAGMVIVDLSQNGRSRGDSINAGRRLYELLEPRLDMGAAFMGVEGVPIQAFGDMQHYAELSLQRFAHPLPVLLVPILEGLNPDDYAFVLLLIWNDIVDLDDIMDSPWRDKLIGVLADKSVSSSDVVVLGNMIRELTAVVLSSRWYENVDRVRDVTRIVGTRLSVSLALITPDEWWASLREYLVYYLHEDAPNAPNVDAMIAALEQMVSNLDNIEQALHPRDVTRTIACTLLWLTKTDLKRCVDLLIEWLDNAEDAKPLHRLMGSAGIQLLFNVFAYAEPALPVATYADFLRLLPPVAKNLRSGVSNDLNPVSTIVAALRRWVKSDVALTEQSEGKRNPGKKEPDAVQDNESALATSWYRCIMSSSAVEDLVDAVRDVNGARYLTAVLDDLDRPLAFEGEEVIDEHVHVWLTHLKLRLAFGGEQALPSLGTGQRYGFVVVDAGNYIRPEQERYALWANALLTRIQEISRDEPGFAVFPLLYRMGQLQPLVVGNDGTIETSDILPDKMPPRPRLLGSLMCRKGLQADSSFVVLFTSGEPLDADDWLEVWREKLLIYTSRDRMESPWVQQYQMVERVKGDDIRYIEPRRDAPVLARQVVDRIMARLRPLVAAQPPQKELSTDRSKFISTPTRFDPAIDNAMQERFDPADEDMQTVKFDPASEVEEEPGTESTPSVPRTRERFDPSI